MFKVFQKYYYYYYDYFTNINECARATLLRNIAQEFALYVTSFRAYNFLLHTHTRMHTLLWSVKEEHRSFQVCVVNILQPIWSCVHDVGYVSEVVMVEELTHGGGTEQMVLSSCCPVYITLCLMNLSTQVHFMNSVFCCCLFKPTCSSYCTIYSKFNEVS